MLDFSGPFGLSTYVWDHRFQLLLSSGCDNATSLLELENHSLGPSLDVGSISLSSDWEITDAIEQPGFPDQEPTWHGNVDIFNLGLDSGDPSSLTYNSTSSNVSPLRQFDNTGPLFGEIIPDFTQSYHMVSNPEPTAHCAAPSPMLDEPLPSSQRTPATALVAIIPAIVPIPRDKRQVKCPKCNSWFRHQGQLK